MNKQRDAGMARVIVVGEGMLELSGGGEGPNWRLGHGGDMLNASIHLARLGEDVAFATALGGDRMSDTLVEAWRSEGLDTSLIVRDPERLPGLYAIHTDPDGERSFSYWRSESAARRMFALSGTKALRDASSGVDLLLFSLISLAVLPPEGREALLGLASLVRGAGGLVAFDGNYRPSLWAGGIDEARAARDAAITVADIGLPTLEDEQALDGRALMPQMVAARWAGLGAAETVVKLGADGCLVDDVVVPPPTQLHPVDTSGAGDAFDAGYLHARLAGAGRHEAALAGHRLAGWVLMRRGAVPPRDADAPYALA